MVQRHSSIYDFSDSARKEPLDTIAEIETILFTAATNARLLTAALHGREEIGA